MDKQHLDRLKKQLQDISEIISAFESEAVQLRVVSLLLPLLEHNSKREHNEPEVLRPEKSSLKSGEKKPGVKKLLDQLIQTNFFDEERTIAEIVKQLNSSGGDLGATQVSGVLPGLIKTNQLKRHQSPVNNRYVYVRS